MNTTAEGKMETEMIDANIATVKSQYSDSIASVRAELTFIGNATRALANGFRVAAALMECFGDGVCTTPIVEIAGEYRERVLVTVTYELVTGDAAEVAHVLNAMHDAVPAPGADATS